VAHSEVQTRGYADEILSALEVAEELRCSKAHVYNVILGRVEGVSPLPAICMGRRRLIRRSALEAWKRGNEQVAAESSR
jgi:excisionase family DNA binding protein